MTEKNEKSYRKLIVHQKADELALEVYQVTLKFPKDELFGLTSQMRRAAVSVPANIAEGYMRQGVKEKLRFYNISQGSLVELEYYIDFSYKLGYADEKMHNKLADKKNETGRLLNGYIGAIRKAVADGAEKLKVEAGN